MEGPLSCSSSGLRLGVNWGHETLRDHPCQPVGLAMNPSFHWLDTPVAFRPGETIAAALRRAGVQDLGLAAGGLRARYFCGIGACQSCLVSVDGASPVEACLTPAQDGMRVSQASPVVENIYHVTN